MNSFKTWHPRESQTAGIIGNPGRKTLTTHKGGRSRKEFSDPAGYNLEASFSIYDIPFQGRPTTESLATLISSKDLSLLKAGGDVENLLEILRTDPKTGIEDLTTIEGRREYYGSNEMPESPAPSWLGLFLHAWKTDVTVQIMGVAGLILLVVGIIAEFVGDPDSDAWIEGIAIIATVLLVTCVTSTNDYVKDKQYRNLKKRSTASREVRVLRDGEDVKLNASELVVGDIVLLFTGDQIPADGVFISSGSEMDVDESAMTGEPEQKHKGKSDPFLLSGTFVTKGTGKLLVCQVGERSEWGQLLANLQNNDEPTPLQKKLGKVVTVTAKAGVTIAAMIFVALLIYWIVDYAVYPYPNKILCTPPPEDGFSIDPITNETKPYWINGVLQVDSLPPPTATFTYCGAPGNRLAPKSDPNVNISHAVYVNSEGFSLESLIQLLISLILAITAIVVAVPEGLPLAVIISLAYTMREMIKDQNLVRHLRACEVMGGITDICSDKTGTLTENRMTVVQAWLANRQFESVDKLELNDRVFSLLSESLVLNVGDGQIVTQEDGKFKFIGSPTECALLVLGHKLGVKKDEIVESRPKVYTFNFTSDRKRMSTVVSMPKDGDVEERYRLYSKGASEIILKRCKKYLAEDGNETKMDKTKRKELDEFIINLASKGLRTIGVAYRDFRRSTHWSKAGEEGKGVEEELTLIGIIGIEDPLRPEVPDAIFTCKRAGITVRMVTGDNILTASKIAQECHIYDPAEGIAIEGPEFAKMSDEEVLEIIDRIQVMARSKPNDKHRLVTLLRQKGRVVSVTGDGTNDGPALRAADVGLAMGIAGTEVAREAADIIILDDNFASIVKSVKWGRSTFDNIRKFLQFQVTANVSALMIVFIGALSHHGSPLYAIQLLWVNIIMNSAALALGTEKPSEELLKRKPHGKDGAVITRLMWRDIIGQALYQIITAAIILFAVNRETNMHYIWPFLTGGELRGRYGISNEHYTLIFNTFVFSQIFNLINSRIVVPWKRNPFSGLQANWLFLVILAAICTCQAIIVEFGGGVMKTVGLSWELWLSSIAIASFTLILGFIFRSIPVPLQPWERKATKLPQQKKKKLVS